MVYVDQRLRGYLMKTNFLKNHSIEIGLLLLFILPPLGIGLLIIIGLIHFIKIFKTKKPLPFTIGSFFFINLLIASIGASFMFMEIKYFMIPILITSYLGYYLYIKEHFSKKLLSNYVRIIIFGGVYIAFIGQFQLLIPEFVNLFQPKSHLFFQIIGVLTGWMPLSFDESNRLFGSAYNPNFAAFFLLMSIALLFWKILSRENILRNSGLLIVLGVAIIQTGSRSGVIGMILLFIIFLFRYRWQIGVGLAGLLSLISLKFDLIDELLPRYESIQASATGRKNIWENSVHIWSDHPFFGVTPLGFREAYDAFAHDKVAHAHNIFLGFFTEYGTIGGLSFVLLFIVIAVKVILVMYSFRNRKKYLDIFLLLMPVFLMTGMLDHPLVSPQTALLTIFLIAGWESYVKRLNFFTKPTVESNHAGVQ